MTTKPKKIAVAMSGGVDSSVAALLLQDQGYEVGGFTIKTWDCKEPISELDGEKTCCSMRDAQDALAVADRLGIPFELIDDSQTFQEKVIKPFEADYRAGRTPIPCTHCNEHIKFGTCLDRMLKKGYDAVATGHYAEIDRDRDTGRFYMRQGRDREKDQTFFLFTLGQNHLQKILFPVGKFTKPEIRNLAEKHGLITADKPGSMDICFVKGESYAEKIQDSMSAEAGDIVHIDGSVLGQHQGLFRYTVGQRKGMGIAYKHALYVISLDMADNRLIIGPDEALFKKELVASPISWGHLDNLEGGKRLFGKIRYRNKLNPCLAGLTPEGKLHVIFDEPVRAITPGQACVLYDETGALALGAWIEKHLD